MQGEDLPQLTNRVDLDPHVKDIFGLPVARTTYHPARPRARRLRLLRPEARVHPAGGRGHLGADGDLARRGQHASSSRAKLGKIPVSRHVVGTARMGTDPETSVCDPFGRLHSTPNVVICDSSPFPTGAGYGPTLTLVALAIRNARAITS